MVKFDISQPIIQVQEIFGFLKGKKLWCYSIGDVTNPIKSKTEETSNCIAMLEESDNKKYQIVSWFHNSCTSSFKL